MTDTPAPGGTDLSMFDALTDLVVVLDGSGTIRYANPFSADLLGFGVDTIVGTSMADHLHPDDLVRALEVMSFIATDEMMVPVTPALYRLRLPDGSWCPVEINATPLPASGTEPAPMLVVGRYSGDRHLQDRTLELLIRGTPFAEVVALVPEFGRWRHPHEHYAVRYQDLDGHTEQAGSDLAQRLLRETEDHPDTPWAIAASTGHDTIVEADDLPEPLRTIAIEQALLACWAMPVADPAWPEPAVIVAWSRDHGPAPSVHRYSLETMARTLTLVLQWRSQVAELRRAANQDPLTGVVNRSGFFTHLTDIAAVGARRCAVLYVDLDGFKAVNDAHGHTVGDAVLGLVADRIQAVVRGDDVVARLGGDEFAVLCPALDDDLDAVAVAERIIEATGRPIDEAGLTIRVGASVGIAVADAGSIAPDDLVDRADKALYRAKAEGRGRWALADAAPPA